MADELLDIVDEHDTVRTQEYRLKVHSESIKYFRVINGFILNDEQKFWIPLRSPHKQLFPSCLDASVGGHVSAGETYEQSFERELQEELNLSVREINYTCIGKLSPVMHNVSGFMQIYIIYSNMAPQYNPNDFVSASWLSIDELIEKINKGAPIKTDLIALSAYLKEYLEKN